MFLVTLSGEERSLAPGKVYGSLGVQREGRVEKAGHEQVAAATVGSGFGVIGLARLSPVSCLPVLKGPGFELSCAEPSLAHHAAFIMRVL